MERKGLISDRCELNRQIKADNRLLRTIKAEIAKLLQAVKNTIPVIAEAMEKLRMNMVVLRYRLLSIGKGKRRLNDYMKAVEAEIERYTGIVSQIKEKSAERKTLATEKKETPFYQVSSLRSLSKRITELTEELEELHSEKEMLLNTLQCDDSGIPGIKRDISNAEANLKRLDEAEQKYKAELDAAYREFEALQDDTAGIDPDELLAARLELRQDYDSRAALAVQQVFSKDYDRLTLHDSRQYVAELLHEDKSDLRAVRNRLRKAEQERQQDRAQEQPKQRKPKDRDYGR